MRQPPIIDLQAIPLDPPPRRPRWTRRAVAIAVAFLFPMGLYFAIAPREKAHRQADIRATIERHAVSRNPLRPPAEAKTAGRPVYPYSVIPGGAYNSAELARAMDSDPVVARHYGEFDRAKLTTTRSVSVRPVYVSYRVGDTIYWSRKPIRLKMGELLVTDGTNFARARCGNRIALTIQSPVAFSEPIPAVLDTPVFVAGRPAIPTEEVAAISPATPLQLGAPSPSFQPVRIAGSRSPGWLIPVAGAGALAGVAAAGANGGSKGGHNGTTPTTDSGGGGTITGGGGTTGGGDPGCTGSNCGGGGGNPGCIGANCGGGGGNPGCIGANCGGGNPGCVGVCGGNPLEVVPEPSFWVPCLIGLAGIAAVQARRRRRARQD